MRDVGSVFVLLFAIVFAVVGGTVAWITEVALFQGMLADAKSRWPIWLISAMRVLGIVLAIGAGWIAAFVVMLLALSVFR